MSECRALVNFIGNAVATLFVAKWNHELDVDRARRVFSGEVLPPPDGDVENDFDMEILEQEPRDKHHHMIKEPDAVRVDHERLDPATAPAHSAQR